MSDGRGGHWNRAGRRSGGARKSVIAIVPYDVPVDCGVPDCTSEATVKVPVDGQMEGSMYVDGKWYVPLCDTHWNGLKGSREPFDSATVKGSPGCPRAQHRKVKP